MNYEKLQFEEDFQTSKKEILALTQSGTGASKLGNAKLWVAHVSLLAYADGKTGEMQEEKVLLTWQLTERQRLSKRKIFNLQGERIYRLEVRETLPGRSRGKKRLLVVGVKKRDCRDSRLEEILRNYQQPVTIHPDGCGELLLNKELELFSGDLMWNGQSCMVHLEADGEGAQTAVNAQTALHALLKDDALWDDRARRLAASELCENANDWRADEGTDTPEITEDDFAKRLVLSEVSVSPDGGFEIYYEDDNMFLGHVVIVSGSIEGGVESATIAG